MKRHLLVKQFDMLTKKHFVELKKIEKGYFMNGKAAQVAKETEVDDVTISLISIEYVTLINTKLLINLFRFMSDKDQSIVFDAETTQQLYANNIKGLIDFDHQVKGINKLNIQLCLSNPSESGLINILADLNRDLDKLFIKPYDPKKNKGDMVHYMYDISNALKSMLLCLRVLTINAVYVGGEHNKYILISKKLMYFLDESMKRIEAELHRVKVRKG